MKIKEKLANFKTNFDDKFEKNKNTFYIFTSIFLPIFIWFSYINFYENKSFPKPLEYLYKVNGVVTSYSYRKKDSTGTMILKLDNGDFERFRIFLQDDEIYKNLKGKKAVIYASEATLLHKKDVEQIEDENGNILMKYDYDLAVKSRSTRFLSNILAFCFNISTFLATILSFAIYYDIYKQNKTKQGVKNG